MAYYIEATGADNHAVREAACACIAELGSKVRRGGGKKGGVREWVWGGKKEERGPAGLTFNQSIYNIMH